MTFARAAVAASLLSAVACTPLWDFSMKASAERDFRALLATCNVRPGSLVVIPVAGSRAARLELDLSAQEVRAIVGKLGLKERDPSAKDSSQGKCGCENHPPLRPFGESKVYGASGRPARLRLKGGSALEFLKLYWNPHTGKACVELEYAYG